MEEILQHVLRPMTPAELVAWRARMGMTAKAAAEALGLSVNGYAAYERGFVYLMPENGELLRRQARSIPKHVALACERLEQLAGETWVEDARAAQGLVRHQPL